MSEASSPQSDNATCPVCKVTTPNLSKVDSGLKLHLQEQGHPDIPDQACSSCLKNFRRTISKGSQLRAKEEAKATVKQELWKNRISLIREGKQYLAHGDLADSVVSYEKYLKILEVVYGVGVDKLEPKLFHDRPKEITIICSVFWDLMLIYDAHIKYRIKQELMTQKLADFLRFSPIYGNIIRKAERHVRRARNPAAFKQLLKLCNVQASNCFIATAAFYPTHSVVQDLCQFRDRILRKSFAGRCFIRLYYLISPRIARWVEHSPKSRRAIRYLLHRIVSLLKRVSFISRQTES